jgi:MinD superfamily P-loop ATPase
MPTTIHVWSPKGGQCTTTVACGIAVALDSPVKIHPREGDSDVLA